MIDHYINIALDLALDYSFAGWLIAIKLSVTVILALSALELIKAVVRAGLKRRNKSKRRRKHH